MMACWASLLIGYLVLIGLFLIFPFLNYEAKSEARYYKQHSKYWEMLYKDLWNLMIYKENYKRETEKLRENKE